MKRGGIRRRCWFGRLGTLKREGRRMKLLLFRMVAGLPFVDMWKMDRAMDRGVDLLGCSDLVFGRILCLRMDEDMERLGRVLVGYLGDVVRVTA